jgi:hypothetical protein
MLKQFLTEHKLYATSPDFSGFLLRLKDAYLRFSLYDRENPITFFPLEAAPGLPPFVAIKLDTLSQDNREYLYAKSENFGTMEKSTLSIANSDCNLKCSYCLNHKRDMTLQFPTASQILTIMEQYRGIETLEITGGEPTQDMAALKEILSNAGPAFKRVHIYTNGINLTKEFIEFLNTLPTYFRLIIAVSTEGSENGHISMQGLYEILERFKETPAERVWLSINIIDAQQTVQLKDWFYDLQANFPNLPMIDTIKLTSPLCKSGTTEDYISHLTNLVDIVQTISNQETAYLRGKALVSLNFNLFPSTRGNPECSLRKVSMFGPKVATCIYKPDEAKIFPSPLGLMLDNVKNNVCLGCSFYPYECKANIATEECKAYNQRCLHCPALNVCHNRCTLRGELTEDDCLFLCVINAFELWLGVKDHTASEIEALWNDKKLII